MKQTILINKEDINDTEIELRNAFIRECIDAIGIPQFSEIWPEDIIELSIDDKIKLRKFLDERNIVIEDDKDGGVKIYIEDNLIAEWKKCKYDLAIDHSQVDPTKKIYVRMHIDYWSVFEEQNENTDDK